MALLPTVFLASGELITLLFKKNIFIYLFGYSRPQLWHVRSNSLKGPPVLGVLSLSNWTTREVLDHIFEWIYSRHRSLKVKLS